MNELMKKPWFKIIAGLVILVILYLAYSVSRGNFSLRKASPAISFSESVMDFGSPGQTSDFASNKAAAIREMKVVDLPPIGQGAGTTIQDDAKIIQSADLTVEVDDSQKALVDIESVATKHNGFLINKNFNESATGQKTASAQIKVPFASFSGAINDIKELANFLAQENINSQDVTEEYTDLQSQLKNLRAEEIQYQEIMKRAFAIEDVLNVASKLADVRGRIERIEGRLNYYDQRTDFSIINIQITEEFIIEAPTNKWRPWQVIKRNANRLVVNLQNFVDNIIGFVFWLVGLIPYLIFLGVIIWIIIAVRGRKKGRPQV